MEAELVSVIVPVYNIRDYLPRCLEAIASQTYRKLEIILVDDGSTDGSGRICEEYAARDSRAKVIHQENQGLLAARNTGQGAATGAYLFSRTEMTISIKISSNCCTRPFNFGRSVMWR